MDQSMSMDHNYRVPFIPSHLYQRNNRKVAHHVPLGCLRSLICLKPQRLVEVVEGGEITRWLRGSQTRHQFWVSLRLEEQTAANIFPCPLRQPQQVHKNQRENFSSSRTKNDRLVSSDSHSKELRETPRRTCFPQKGVERRTTARVISTSRHSEVSKNVQFHKDGTTRDSVQTPNTSSVPEPPNVETPEMPHCSSTSPSNVQHLLFPPNQAKTPPRTENSSILVKDTPEKDYGLRVTWRWRKGLMKLLIDRGQLLPADAGVASDWT